MQFKDNPNPIVFRDQKDYELKLLERELEELLVEFERIEAEKNQDSDD